MNTTSEEKEAIAHLTLRQMLDSIPVVGSFLNNVFFEFRSKVKQDRVNRLIEGLAKELVHLDIDPQQLHTEEHVDLFDTIFTKVANTRSEKKREGLKNILVHGIQHPCEIEYCEIFADCLLTIHPKELEILAAHPAYLLDGKGLIPRINELKTELNFINQLRMAKMNPHNISMQVQVQEQHKYVKISPERPGRVIALEKIEAEKFLERYREECGPERFGITKDELKFFLQSLLSKGLLQDDGVGTYGMGTTEFMSITNLGLKFLEFIKV